MKVHDIIIRPLRSGDEGDIEHICYSTGLNGGDLAGTGMFNDRRLFGLLFSLYYPRHEAGHCFVAEDASSGRVAGYVLSAPDSRKQESRFFRSWMVRIVLRAVMVSWWRYPESFRAAIHFNGIRKHMPPMDPIYDEYPAHLHINILDEYQRMGIGDRLILEVERVMKESSVRGIHLITSDSNTKAVPFYKKMGYEIIREFSPGMWPQLPHVGGLIFAKHL